MSRLSLAKQAEVIAHLCEGAGIRPCARLTNTSTTTIMALLLRVGAGCDRLHDRLVRNLDIRDVQADELWTFIQKKQARIQPGDDPTWGDAYTFLGIARTQKVIISYLVGKRDERCTQAFTKDLRSRLIVVPNLSTDGFGPYATAVGQHFEAADYGQLIKNYSRSPRRVRDGQPSDHRYEPPRDPFAVRTPIYGAPEISEICTSHVERLNLDVRMSVRRLTRLCNGFSRKLTHLTAAMSLFVAHHNFVRIHGALRVTPAMEAGLAPGVWSVEELVERALAASAEPVAKPEKQPLRLPVEAAKSATPARPLANGGWLRLVTPGGAPTPSGPAPAPQVAPAASAHAVEAPAVAAPAADPSGQLDLLAWRPEPAPRNRWEQLDLFGPRA